MRAMTDQSVLRLWTLTIALLVGSVSVSAAEPLLLDVARAELAYDLRSGELVVNFVLTQPSAGLFARLTADNVGRRIAIGVGGKVFERPVVREPILGSSGQISGMTSVEEARDIAARLSSGAAKLELEALAD
jgi:preprotein translocase subunit SecD